MSVDVLSLGLAAAMPVGVFLLYLWARSRGEARGRRPSRSRRVETRRALDTARPSDTARSPDSGPVWPVATQHPLASEPRRARPPLTPAPTPAQPLSPEPRHAEPALRLAPPRGDEQRSAELPIQLAPPQSSQPSSAHPRAESPGSVEPRRVLAKLPSSRPSLDSAPRTAVSPVSVPTPTAGADRLLGNGWPVGEPPSQGPRTDRAAALLPARFLAHPIAPPADPVAIPASTGDGVRRPRPKIAADDDVAGRPPNRGLLAATMRPIRTVLGRLGGHPTAAEPHWPDPGQSDPAVRLFEYFEDTREPCPACADWYEKRARFCRRCGRPVDARSRSTADSPSMPAMPVPTSTGTAATAGQAMPANPQPAVQSAVVRPARYVPAAPPVAATAAATSPSPVIAIGTKTPAGVAVGPGAPLGAPPSVRTGGAPSRRAAGRNGAAGAGHAGEHAAPPDPPTAAPAPAHAVAARNGMGDVIDLNHASIAELSTLRGVGPATARRIVAARDEHTFDTVDALAERRLVAPSVLVKLRDRVTVASSAD